jgi:hypothetical protein
MICLKHTDKVMTNQISVPNIKELYYKCHWCKNLLRNTAKNRRLHSLKCQKKYDVTKTCHCKDRCIVCLEHTDQPEYYAGCGCTYCPECDVGFPAWGRDPPWAKYIHNFCDYCVMTGVYIHKNQ